MRTDVTAPELALIATGEFDEHWRVKVANGDGTLIDVSSRVSGISFSLPSPDSPIGRAELTFLREVNDDETASLAPLVDASDFNRLDDGITISPLFQIARAATVEIAVTARRAARPADVSALWHEVVGGYLKQPSWPQQYGDVSLEVYDRAYPLLRTFVESPATYPLAMPIEDAIQAVLDDVMGSGAYSLDVDDVAALGVTGKGLSKAYVPSVAPVWEAIQGLAASIGWVLWYRYDASGDAQLVLTEPRRAKVAADYTFALTQIRDVTALTIVEEDIRNVVVVAYVDADGVQQTVTAEDAASIAKYGGDVGIRRYMRIVEDASSPIRTQTSAEDLRDAALSDLKDPDADQAIETKGAWWIGEPAVDLYAFAANVFLYDNAQTLAPYAISIEARQGQLSTATIAARGKPSGGSGRWLGRRPGDPTLNPVSGSIWAVVDPIDEDMGLWAQAFGSASLFPVTADVYEDDPTGAALVAGHVFAAPEDTIGPTGSGATTEYADLTEIPLVAGALKSFWIRLVDAAGAITWAYTSASLGAADAVPLSGRMWVAVDPATQTLDVYASVVGGASAFPATLQVYQTDPTGTPLDTPTSAGHSFAASGEIIGPVGSGVTAEYAALTGIALPKTGIIPFHGKVTDALGNVAWLYCSGDLNNLPGGSVTVNDYRPDASLVCRYDDDVAEIVITTPSGNKTFTGLSGGGFVTYTVGDSPPGEAALAPRETRAGYVVTYYGLASSGGPTFVPFDGALHGEGAGVPSLVIESETEVTLEGEEITATEDAHAGSVASFTNDTWDNLQTGLNLSLNFSRVETYLECWLGRDASGSASEWARIWRSFIAFPTTAVAPGSQATEDSFVRLHVVLAPQTTIAGQSVVLTACTPADSGTMVANDWLTCDGAQVYSLPIAVADLTNGSDQVFQLTAAGAEALTAAIELQTPFVVGVQIVSDAENAEPTISSPTTELNARTRFASVNHGTAAFRPVLSVTANVPQARVILRHSDPAAATTEIQYRTKIGAAAWDSGWLVLVDDDPDPVPVGILSAYPIDVTMYESPPSYVQARLVYVLAGETFYSSPITSSGLDLGKLPNVVVTAVVDKDWQAFPEIKGDLDTRSTKTAVASGAAPTPPTRSDCRLRDALDGRSPTVDEVAFAYDDIPVQLEPGQKVIFAVLGFTAAAGGGDEATDVRYAEASRPFEAGSALPRILTLTVSATDDGVGGVDVTADWTTENASDGTHEMEVSMEWPASVDAAWYETDTSPVATPTLTHNFGGLGQGGGSEIPATTKCKITIVLTDGSDDVDSMVRYTVGIAQ